ncbi:MAG: GNAT family N-acetyltransferase [Clostridium sp.]
MKIEAMEKVHWEEVEAIYVEGIETLKATFRDKVPTYEEFDVGHIKEGRLVGIIEGKVVGWIALSKVSARLVYDGVMEVSIYIKEDSRGKGVGKALLNKVIEISEENDIWSLQSVIIKENIESIKLHQKCGFREIGVKERIAKMKNGVWHDVVLMERRSRKI